MFNRKKGFTLVELLIVIVVIGILSAMMMLSSTEAVSSAKANNVISNIHNLKTATLAFYVDNIDKITHTKNGSNEYYWIKDPENKYAHMQNLAHNYPELITKYLSNGDSIKINLGDSNTTAWTGNTNECDGYAVIDGQGGPNGGKMSEWYIAYGLPKTNAKLKAKLQSRAKSAGLLQNASTSYNGGDWLYVKVLDLSE